MNIDTIHPGMLRVLVAILKANQKRPVLTVRDIVRELVPATVATTWVYYCLKKLRACGLVSYVDGETRTIRATCSLAIYKEALN